MGLPQITRGIGFRDDGIDGSLWGTDNTTHVTPGAITTDGDVLNCTFTFSSAVTGNYGQIRYLGTIPALSPSSYKRIIIRHQENFSVANPQAQLIVSYTDTSTDTFALTNTTTFLAETFALSATKTVSVIAYRLTATGSLTGAFTENLDFTLIFKETLTLPTASRTVRQRSKRNIVKIPIPFREGNVTQDLGSDSPEYDIAGQLITTGPYTADQWWGIFQGLKLETGTAQADGNPTWQWFTWDQGSAKVLVVSFVADENPGRIQNWDYQIQMTQFDILGRTFANPVGGVLASY